MEYSEGLWNFNLHPANYGPDKLWVLPVAASDEHSDDDGMNDGNED